MCWLQECTWWRERGKRVDQFEWQCEAWREYVNITLANIDEVKSSVSFTLCFQWRHCMENRFSATHIGLHQKSWPQTTNPTSKCVWLTIFRLNTWRENETEWCVECGSNISGASTRCSTRTPPSIVQSGRVSTRVGPTTQMEQTNARFLDEVLSKKTRGQAINRWTAPGVSPHITINTFYVQCIANTEQDFHQHPFVAKTESGNVFAGLLKKIAHQVWSFPLIAISLTGIHFSHRKKKPKKCSKKRSSSPQKCHFLTSHLKSQCKYPIPITLCTQNQNTEKNELDKHQDHELLHDQRAWQVLIGVKTSQCIGKRESVLLSI